MKRITIIAVLVMLGVTSMAQTTKATGGFEDVLTTDTVLNNFMLHWIGKPYKLGGKTEKGIDCSQFNKRLYKDVYSKDINNSIYEYVTNNIFSRYRLEKIYFYVEYYEDGELFKMLKETIGENMETGNRINPEYFKNLILNHEI
jgi:hypothetical protein